MQSGRIGIVHCIGTMAVGGAKRQLVELISRLPPERFEQSLVLLRNEGELIPRVEAAGCPVVTLTTRPARRRSVRSASGKPGGERPGSAPASE
ncbi:MAG: hypothetical protein ACR2O6_08510 [Ilumatobacteraceae bacterium]